MSSQMVGRPPDNAQLAAQLVIEPRIAYHALVQSVMLDLKTQHPFYTWWWCERGRARVRSGRQDHEIRVGQWVLLPPHRERHHRIDEGTVLISISFVAAWATGVPLLAMRCPLVADGEAHGPLRDAALRVCSGTAPLATPAISANGLGVAACRLRAALARFVTELFERAIALGCVANRPGCGDARLDELLREIRLRPSAGPLPWSEWSRRVGLGRSQLNRLCRETHGVSLRRQRDRLLLDELRQRLAVGTQSIKEVAAAFGFVDTAHLCRWTRRHTGQSPADLRRAASP